MCKGESKQKNSNLGQNSKPRLVGKTHDEGTETWIWIPVLPITSKIAVRNIHGYLSEDRRSSDWRNLTEGTQIWNEIFHHEDYRPWPRLHQNCHSVCHHHLMAAADQRVQQKILASMPSELHAYSNNLSWNLSKPYSKRQIFLLLCWEKFQSHLSLAFQSNGFGSDSDSQSGNQCSALFNLATVHFCSFFFLPLWALETLPFPKQIIWFWTSTQTYNQKMPLSLPLELKNLFLKAPFSCLLCDSFTCSWFFVGLFRHFECYALFFLMIFTYGLGAWREYRMNLILS